MITIPPERQYTLSQLEKLMLLYMETRKQFYVPSTDVTYEALLGPQEHLNAFFEWIRFNEGKIKL